MSDDMVNPDTEFKRDNSGTKNGGESGICRIIRYGTMSDDMVNPDTEFKRDNSGTKNGGESGI